MHSSLVGSRDGLPLGMAATSTNCSALRERWVRIFLVRTCVDRLAGDGGHTVGDEMKQARVQGLHRVQIRNKRGEFSTAVLEIRCRRLVVRPPIGKEKDYPELLLTVIHAQERDTPKRPRENRLEVAYRS